MNYKRIVVTLAIALAVATAFTYYNTLQTSAIGGFFKNKATNAVENKASQEATEGAKTETKSTEKTQKPTSSEPITYENSKYKYKLLYPGNWVLKDDDATKSSLSITDDWGKKGSISVNATWMSDDFPTDPAFKALIDKAEQRKKHGELEEYYVKKITVKGKDGKPLDVVKGVVVIESNEDPDMKRMQWEAYGGGNYYNFTTASNVANFPDYKETFKKFIDSIEFDFAKGTFK